MAMGLLVVGIGVVFLVLGLDQADKAASVTGALVGLAGLGFSVWTYMRSSRSPKDADNGNRVRVDNSSGVQIGDYSVQNNNISSTQSDDKRV